MSVDQDGCERVNVSSGTALPGLSRTKAIKQLCVFVWQFVIDKLLFCVTHRIIHWANISILVTQGLI